ncbi:GntR family transcriptional regulator [Paracoccus sp. UBA5162]|jgi:DNA-binding GntR family transcriptional regulator|uniref:GntR family transcriptional regulator n=1 Tax=Paracoccus sp. UBA5162 TaxID=1947054 RepID=UPI0026007352|nr:GntR family transcriptional regulator [Paracoccus sp. UBA5162]|tara:strand:- start:871 stop:1551 length:681 start_codon:yes stop_codon:yes gene_type:complete
MDQRPRINPGISTAQQVHDWLHDLILRGDLLPGTQLSESEIAGRVGVSRQPVREAFIRLAGAGLTEVRPQRGTFIGRISLREVLAVRAIREAVESDMIRILTQRMTDDIHRDLREQLDRQRAAAVRRDVNGFVLLDNLFHRTLATAAGHEDVWHRIERMTSQMDRLRYLAVQTFEADALIEQHRDIVDAGARGDAAGAEAAIRRHLRQLLEDLPRITSDRAEFFTD